MTRGNLNIVLPDGKVMHWYKNGDQYPDGLVTQFNFDNVLYDLAFMLKHGDLKGSGLTDAIKDYIERWYNFAYHSVTKYDGGCTPIYIKDFVVTESHTDYNYILDLKLKHFHAYNWDKPIFGEQSRSTDEDQTDWLHRVAEWFNEQVELDANRVLVTVKH